MHDLSVIVTLAGGLAVALVLGWITRSLGLSTLVGYMLAGIVVGPFTPGFVADAKLAQQMADKEHRLVRHAVRQLLRAARDFEVFEEAQRPPQVADLGGK